MLTECDQIPKIRDEILSPKGAEAYSHLKDIAKFIPSDQESAEIMVLIGRDLLPACYVVEEPIGPIACAVCTKVALSCTTAFMLKKIMVSTERVKTNYLDFRQKTKTSYILWRQKIC